MNDVKGRQVAFNLASQGQWLAFEGHRRNLLGLLADTGRGGRGRLCVLGAGNANDLDLPALLDVYREVHLVDLDASALAGGAERQGTAGRPGLKLFGGVDVTGLVDVMSGWRLSTTVTAGDLQWLVEGPTLRVPQALDGPYDVVASTCLLSQIIGNAHHAVGEAHPFFGNLVRAIRLGHLRLMTGLLTVGGAAVLVTDVVSSDTLPGLANLGDEELAGVLPGLVREGNLFHGVNPWAITGTLGDPAAMGFAATAVEPIRPWRWNLHDRVYLVWAVKWRVMT